MYCNVFNISIKRIYSVVNRQRLRHSPIKKCEINLFCRVFVMCMSMWVKGVAWCLYLSWNVGIFSLNLSISLDLGIFSMFLCMLKCMWSAHFYYCVNRISIMLIWSKVWYGSSWWMQGAMWHSFQSQKMDIFSLVCFFTQFIFMSGQNWQGARKTIELDDNNQHKYTEREQKSRDFEE